MLLEQLVEESQQARYVIVMLGNNQEVMQQVAGEARSFLDSGELQKAVNQAYLTYLGEVKVLVAADLVQAAQLYKEKGYHRVAGIILHPSDTVDGDHLLRVLNDVDRHRVTDISQHVRNREKPILTESGALNTEHLYQELVVILEHYANTLKQVKERHSPAEVNSKGLLTPARVTVYDATLEEVISTREGLNEEWNLRKAVEEVNTKRLREAVEHGQQPRTVTPRQVREAVQVLREAQLRELSGEDHTREVTKYGPDNRRMSDDLGEHVDRIFAAATGAMRTDELTHFYLHATRGAIGLFSADEKASSPDEKFLFLKKYGSAEEVERQFAQYLFNQFDLLKERGIAVMHQPAAYSYSEQDNEFVVLSKAPLLAVTSEVIWKVRELGQRYFDLYRNALTEIGFQTLVSYIKAAKKEPDAQQRALIMHRYKATLTVAAADMERATGESLSETERALWLESLGTLFDGQAFWNPAFFGPVMDFKPNNYGNRMGTLNPTKEEVLAALFGNAQRPTQAAVTNRMKSTFGILEHEGRPGITLEDYFHHVNSMDLNEDPSKKPQDFQNFITQLWPTASKEELAGIWPAYFTMELYKAQRKMQRTLHYMIANLAHARNREERSENNLAYNADYAHYREIFVQAAYAATVMNWKYAGEPFDEQLVVLGQLYSDKNPQFPPNPKSLPTIARAFYSSYLALQRLINEPPKQTLLRNFEVAL